MDTEPNRDLEAAVRDVLSQVIDPELGLPITDLGLIYGVEIDDGTVTVDMTTTTPVCPLGSYLAQEAEARLRALAGVDRAVVRAVHEPPWSPELMSERARTILGIR